MPILTVIIKDNGEPKVVKYTYTALWNELKGIPGVALIIADSWFQGLQKVNPKTKFVCFVEADCLVSSGYFESLLGLMNKIEDHRHIAVLSPATAVRVWVNRIYGYGFHDKIGDSLVPRLDPKYAMPYPVQAAYIPGALIRLTMLQRYMEEHSLPRDIEVDLQRMSIMLSFGFWLQHVNNGIGERVYVSPNTVYATTEEYVNSIYDIDSNDFNDIDTLKGMFRSQSIGLLERNV